MQAAAALSGAAEVVANFRLMNGSEGGWRFAKRAGADFRSAPDDPAALAVTLDSLSDTARA
jgi:hypothetical protein